MCCGCYERPGQHISMIRNKRRTLLIFVLSSNFVISPGQLNGKIWFMQGVDWSTFSGGRLISQRARIKILALFGSV